MLTTYMVYECEVNVKLVYGYMCTTYLEYVCTRNRYIEYGCTEHWYMEYVLRAMRTWNMGFAIYVDRICV